MSGEQQKQETKARENLEKLTSEDLLQNTITDEIKHLKSELTNVNDRIDSVTQQVTAYKTTVEIYKDALKIQQKNVEDSSAVLKFKLDILQLLVMLVLSIILIPVAQGVWNKIPQRVNQAVHSQPLE